MFKACAFRTRIQDFFKDYAEKMGLDYYHLKIKDMFGIDHYVTDIQMITTDNAVKWKKFVPLMGGTLETAYDYWC